MEQSRQNQMTEEEALRSYRDAFERERQKNRVLSGKLADAEQKEAELGERLGRIKGSVFWRMSKPLRSFVHWVQRTRQRLGYYGGPKGIARKLNAKKIERTARTQHGTASFPNAEEAKRQSEFKFARNIKFSILMPLYNTPERFLRQAIDSVRAQTYGNWELCLADGSDKEHSDVKKICQEYAARDSRIIYRKLAKNEGISGNTNICFGMSKGEYIALFAVSSISCGVMSRMCSSSLRRSSTR